MEIKVCTVVCGWQGWVAGYLFSVFIGALAAGIVVDVMRRLYGGPRKSQLRLYVFDFMLGSVERLVITSIAIHTLAGAGAFVITWMGLKLAANWNRPGMPIPPANELGDGWRLLARGSLTAMTGSLVSAAMAFIGAAIICLEF